MHLIVVLVVKVIVFLGHGLPLVLVHRRLNVLLLHLEHVLEFAPAVPLRTPFQLLLRRELLFVTNRGLNNVLVVVIPTLHSVNPRIYRVILTLGDRSLLLYFSDVLHRIYLG